MSIKGVHPQEIIVWNILPFLRREISFEMKNQGIDQKRIASLLDVSEPAISQYFNKKRAQSKIKVSPELRKEIVVSAKKIVGSETSMLFEMQRLISLPDVRRIVCSIHREEFGAPKNCNLCSMGVK
ncbi:MAG: hypothetical protein WCK90_04270 [archaeon]